MIPRTLSASSLAVADGCMARWRDEYFLRGANFQGLAANVGIVCHGTLEDFLRAVFIRKSDSWDEGLFWKMFNENALKILGPSQTSAEYEDANDICRRWFNTKNRYDDLAAVQILSLESKNTFMLKISGHEIPFNYIMDRLDRIGPGEYRVVDYKTNRVGLNANQLRGKLQARLYALMVQIAYKDAEKIWVQFDFLRHEPVEVLFTRDENIAMWKELKQRAQDIVDTQENRAAETLNPDCGWCVRKASCKKLQSHINVGGILSKTPDELAEIHYNLLNQKKAQEQLLGEVETQLLRYAVNENLLEFETEFGTVSVTAKVTRSVDNELAAAILGPLAGNYQRFSVTDIDKILKQKILPQGQADMLKEVIKKNVSAPTIKVDHSGY